LRIPEQNRPLSDLARPCPSRIEKIRKISENAMKAIKTTRSTLLILALNILVIGLVIVMGVRLDRATEEGVVTRFSQRQLLLAEQTAAGIQSIFDEAQRDLLHLKEGPIPQLAEALETENEEGLSTWRELTEQCFSNYLHTHPIYAQIRYLDAGGQEIVGVDSDGEGVRIIPQDQLWLQAERDFFVATMQLDAEEVHVSPIEPALGHGEVGVGTPTVRLATPLFDSQGRRAGIIILNLTPGEIRGHIARLSAEEGVDAWVLDETGIEVINVSHPEREGSNAYHYCQQTGDETLIALTEDMMAGGRGVETYLWPESAGGPLTVTKLMAYAPLYPAEGHIWSVSVSVPYDLILAMHHYTRQGWIILGTSIVTIILAGAILIARLGHQRAMAEEQARRSEELEALHEISLAITAQLELDDLLHNVVEQGCRLLKVDRGGIYLLDETGTTLELAVSHNWWKKYPTSRIASGRGVAGRVLQSGEPLAVDDYHHWEGRIISDWDTESISAALGVPLKRGDQVIGVLDLIETSRTRSFDEHQVRLATLFANQAAVAIENAQLFTSLAHEKEQLGLLYRLSRYLSESLDVRYIAQRALDEMRAVVGAMRGVALVREPDSDYLRLVAVSGYDAESVEALDQRFRLRLSKGLAGRVAVQRCPALVDDVTQDESWMQVSGLDDWVRSALSVPLLSGDELVGVLSIYSDRKSFFDADHCRLAESAAAVVAAAIANAQLYEQAQRRLESLTNLSHASQVITSSLDVEGVLQQIVELAGSVVNSDYTSVALLDKEGKPILGAGDFRGVPPITRRIRNNGITSHVLDSGQPVIVDAITDEGTTSPPLRRPDGELIKVNPDIVAVGIRSCAAMPIQSKGRTLGVMFMHSCEPHTFHGQLPLLTTFANQAAVALENAQLYEKARQEIAERRRTEESLRETRDYLDKLIQYANAPIIVWNPDLEITRLNGAFERLTGYTADEVIGQDLSALFLETSRDESLRKIILASSDKHWESVEIPVLRKDGEIRLALWNSANIYAEDGVTLLATIAQGIDITERKRAEEALERRATQLAALSEVGRQITSLLELDPLLDRIARLVHKAFNYRYVSILLIEPGVKELTLRAGAGYELERVRAANLKVGEEGICGWVAGSGEPLLVNDVSQEALYYPVEQLPDTRSELTVPLRVKDRIIGVLDVQSAEREAFDQDDLFTLQTLADQVGTAIENAQLHQETRQQAQQVQQIMETVPEGVLLLDAAGRVILTNPVAETVLSVLTSARVGDTLTHLGGRPLAELLTSPPKGLWHEVTIPGGDRPEQSRSFELIARPMEVGPETRGWVLVIRDVTQERAIQQHFQQQDRLVAVGQLAAGIAHDFNNIMAVIILYSQMSMRMQDLSDKAQQHLDTIVQQAKRASSLIEQILDFSRQSALERQPLDLTPFLKEMVKLLQRTLPESIQVDLAHGESEYVIDADPTRIQQVMMNLAINARDAMPEGGSLRLRLEQIEFRPGETPPLPEMEPGEWVQMTVMDSGTGIPADVRPHIFDPFFTTKEPGKGTGLGLAQVYGIVKQHGGYIDVAGRAEGGTTFTLYLPALPAPQAETLTVDREALPEGHGETVLVVEDNPATREALRTALEGLNYLVLEAANGREALAIFEQRRDEIALVMSDLVMPEMGGKALLHALRERDPTVKVVVVSSHPLQNEVRSLKLQGDIAWLRKPTSLDQLAQVVARALKEEK